MRRKVYNVPQLQAALRRLPKELSRELREASLDISADVARGAEARRDTRQARLVPVLPRKDRVPKVVMDGRRMIRPGVPVSDVMWGANFGAKRYPQFPPVVKPDHFLFATIADMRDDILDRYGDALGAALAKI